MNTEERKQRAGNIRRRRLALGWTQEELAEKAGVSLGTVGNAENGTTIPQAGRLGMMLDALAEGERQAADAPPRLAADDRQEMEDWLRGTIAVHSRADRAEIANRFADVYDRLRGTLSACWILLDLGVDIELVRRLMDAATEAFIASGSYVALSTAGVGKAEEFLSESGALSAEINKRKAAGDVGQPSFISKMMDRVRREAYKEGVAAAARADMSFAADLEFEAHLDGDIDYDDDADLPQALPLRRGMPGGAAPLADAARKTNEEPGLKKARREHDEAAERIEDDRAGMEPS